MKRTRTLFSGGEVSATKRIRTIHSTTIISGEIVRKKKRTTYGIRLCKKCNRVLPTGHWRWCPGCLDNFQKEYAGNDDTSFYSVHLSLNDQLFMD